MAEASFKASDFEPVSVERDVQSITRPSLSYWQDAWIRLKGNRRALLSLYIVVGLLVFTIGGPLVWHLDPSAQDLDQVSQPPGADRSALIVEPFQPWEGARANPETGQPDKSGEVRLAEPATSQAARIIQRHCWQ
jgi:oligopeptide transport system permease protein